MSFGLVHIIIEDKGCSGPSEWYLHQGQLVFFGVLCRKPTCTLNNIFSWLEKVDLKTFEHASMQVLSTPTHSFSTNKDLTIDTDPFPLWLPPTHLVTTINRYQFPHKLKNKLHCIIALPLPNFFSFTL